jgi:hypothetical protein
MRARWVPLIATLLLAPACSSSDNEPAAATTTAATPAPPTTPTTTAAPTTTAPATTTTTVVDEEAAVIAAYLAYWDTLLIVTNPGQPDSPLIDQVATGAAADRLRQIASERLAADEATALPEPTLRSHDVRVVSRTGSESVIRDCNVDDSFRLDLSTGERTNADVETNLWRALLRKGEDGAWRVAETMVLNQWSGVTACDQ